MPGRPTSGQGGLDSFDDLRCVRLHGRREAGDDLAVAVHEELLEVPLHQAWQDAVLELGELRVERVLVLAPDVGLGCQRERHAEVALAEFDDLGVGPGLLSRELVARDAEDLEALIAELVVQRLEPGVLGRETALERHVYHQHHLPLEAAKVGLGAVDESQGNGVQSGHGRVLADVGGPKQGSGTGPQ